MPFLAPLAPILMAGAAIAGAVHTISSSNKQAKEAKNAASDAAAKNAAAIQDVKDSQANASTVAQKQLLARRRAGTQTTFTSPLGVGDQASTAKKTLLGQ